MTLLTIVQNAARLMSLTQPVTVVNSTDVQVQQLYGLANEEGDELMRDNDFQVMRQQHLFTTVAAAEQPAAVPDDWDHFVTNTFFNRTTVKQILGPITPQQWQAIQAQPQLNSVYLAFIERTGDFLITPTPPAGNVIAYEYITKNWAQSAAGVPKPAFTADSDTAFISERLITLGIRWRFLSAKGLDYAEAMRTYEREKQKVKARDGGNTMISSTGWDGYLLYPNIPQGSFPGP